MNKHSDPGISDESSGHIFPIADAVVSAVADFFHNRGCGCGYWMTNKRGCGCDCLKHIYGCL